MQRWVTSLMTLAVLTLWAAAWGQLPGLGGVPRGGAEAVTARAVISAEPLTPGGEAKVAVELTIVGRYHVQSAFAAKPYIAAKVVVKSLPPGVSAGAVEAQTGTDIASPPALGSGTLSVYEGKAYFLVPLKVAADAAAGAGELELSLLTQACTDTTCEVPKTTVLKVAVVIGRAGDVAKEANGAVFAAAGLKAFAAQPLPPPAASTSAPGPSASTGAAAPGAAGAGKVVPLLSNDEQVSLIKGRAYGPLNAAEHEHTLAELFLLALLGGLILNVMPCVLPVIPLKALSFIQQAQGSHRTAVLHSVAFSAGIVALFAVLGVLLRVLGFFYGQQFQSPWFLITMVMFVVALALSMLGIWTIQPPRAVYSVDEKFSHRAGFIGSFASGLMATLLATPCSGPFLAPVFAWALVHPAWLTAAMLAVVGVGMSLPYLLLAMFPGLLSKIPRAGRWSELLKQGLGIVMLGVAVYLVTLVPSTHLWPWVLAGTIVVALVCWGWGQIPTPLMTEGRIWTIRSIVVAAGIGLGAGVYWIAALTQPTTVVSPMGTAFLPDHTTEGDTWLPFNVALLDQALKDGRPVVVDWTADWCINCRVLEATVLNREQTRGAFVKENAVLLRADLSQENPPADALNKKLGGEAIPVLAIFAPSRPEQPVVLRDSYSQTRVIHEVQAAR